MTEDEPNNVVSMAVERPPSGDAEGRAMRNRIAGRMFGEHSGPVHIGRFEMLGRIGAGGMGVVYKARDPVLGRHVALKLLHSYINDEHVRARLLREGQALARLSHPNVVQLYEVSEHRDGLFLAMEYVPGLTLRQWQASAGRTWQMLLKAYTQAGRGLAAAHAQGLIHRDFKPSNVIMGIDDRARVADFGLAHGPGLAVDTGPGNTATASDTSQASRITRTGAVLGTPAYMSPEQQRGEVLDARSDQYSFCVSLWEAAFGERPKPNATTEDLGPVARSHPLSSSMPASAKRRLLRVLTRGVRRQPDERWPSMGALLEALGVVGPPPRWRGPLIVAGLLGLTGWTLLDLQAHPVCTALERAAPHWGSVQEQELKSAAAALGLDGHEHMASSIHDALQGHMRDWSDASSQVCEDAKHDPLVEARGQCLDLLARRFEREAAALLKEPWALLGAHEVLGQLVPAKTCQDAPQAVLRDPDVDLDEPTLSALALSRVHSAAGRYDEALSVLDELERAQTQTEASLPLIRTTLGRAEVQQQRGERTQALALYRQAVEHSLQLDHRALEARALAGLADLEADREDHESARWSARQCRAVAQQLGSPLARAYCLTALARVTRGPRAFEETERLLQQALELRRSILGPGHPGEWLIRKQLANTYADLGERDGDPAMLTKARELYAAEHARLGLIYGPQHPAVLVLDFNLSLLDISEGHHQQAHDRLRRVVGGFTAAYGERSIKLGGPLLTLAQLDATRGDIDHAWTHLERAIGVQAMLPPEHTESGSALNFAAQLAAATLDPERALSYYEALGLVWAAQTAGDRPLVWHNVAYYRCIVQACSGAADALVRVDPRLVAGPNTTVRLNADSVAAMIALTNLDALHARDYADRVLRGLDDAQVENARAFEAEAHWTLARAAGLLDQSNDAARHAARALAAAEGDPVTRDTLRRLDGARFARHDTTPSTNTTDRAGDAQ